MTEMTAMPEVPQPRKPAQWKVIIPVVLVLILCCLCIVASGVLMYLGTRGIGPLSSLANSPILSSSPSVVGDWDLYYDWSCSSSYSGPSTFSFDADGTYFAYEETGGAYGTWRVQGKTLDFMYDTSPNAHYIGTINDTGDYAEGSMSTSDGSSGCWYANKR